MFVDFKIVHLYVLLLSEHVLGGFSANQYFRLLADLP